MPPRSVAIPALRLVNILDAREHPPLPSSDAVGRARRQIAAENHSASSLSVDDARWAFAGSTAGMIVGGIGEGFAMNVLVFFEESSAIDSWVYLDGTGDKRAITTTATLTILGEPSTTCRADCTRP